MNKARLNFWVDVVIGVAGAGGAVSGLAFLLPSDATGEILAISLRTWSAVHTWSSLAAIAGVGVHLALHWRWVIAMVRQALRSAEGRPARAAGTGLANSTVGVANPGRRAFLTIGGLAAAAAAAAGYRIFGSLDKAGDNQSDGLTAGTGQETGVACRFGLVNDPYPGQCRHYVDSDGDGICDYSVAGSGSLVAADAGTSLQGRLPRRQGNWGRP